MTDAADPFVIPMIQYSALPGVFVPLEGQSEDVVEFVCTAEDWSWRVGADAFATGWAGVLASMREHQANHACQT